MTIWKTTPSLKNIKIWVNTNLSQGIPARHVGRQNGLYVAKAEKPDTNMHAPILGLINRIIEGRL